MAAWDRIAKDGIHGKAESPSAWAGFKLYRDAGPRSRSLARVAELLNHNSRRAVARWSHAHRWVDRAAAYDAHVDETEQAEKADARADEIRHVFRARRTFWRAAELAGLQLVERLEHPDNPLEVTPKDAKAIVDAALALSGHDEPDTIRKTGAPKTIRQLLADAGSAIGGIVGLESDEE